MNSSKMQRFFPNECYVCKSRDNLKRCKCNMISYCSEHHQLKHLPVHGSFCKIIKELLKEKKVAHIYEELQMLGGDAWREKKEKITNEVTKKLGRPMSLFENAMWAHPRLCHVCNQTRQEDLSNCPDCPVASFCKKHPRDEIHSMNCKVMNQYLKILNTAEELNIDLKFLSPNFPCIKGEKVNHVMDSLTLTYKANNMEERCLKSRLLKMDLINFMDAASKINSALQKVHETIPEELTIHIDALSYEHAITKENYWEFLLHLNPQIKKLKILVTQTENRNDSKSLCKKCHSKGKELIIEYSTKSYEDYMLDENYQKPDILFYVKVDDECNSERFNKWSEFNCPVILRFDSKMNFCKVHYFLSLLKAKFRFIYEGKIKAPFGILSSIENEDYFIILQSMENKVHEKCCDKITTTVTHQCGENSSENDVEDASKVIPSDLKDNSDNNENSKLETNENQSTSENRESNKEEKSEVRVTLSPSSSKRSFATISEPGEEEEKEKNKKAKTESCKNISKSIDKENFDSNSEEGKNTKENNVEKKNIEKRNEKEDKHKKFLVNSECFKNHETVNVFQSFVIGHVSDLRNENEGLRQQLNLALKEITKLQTKFDQVCFKLKKKEKVIQDLLRVFVNFENTDAVCEENKI